MTEALPKITEAEFMAQIVQLAAMHCWMIYHTHDSRNSPSGFPDLFLVRGRVLIAAELKRSPKEKPTLDQKRWLAALNLAGVNCFLWTPADWPEIEKVLA